MIVNLEDHATYGGPGFAPRAADMAADIRQGVLWKRCGVSSEIAPLRDVLLSVPGQELCFADPPERWLMLDRIDLPAIRGEFEAVASLFTSLGVDVTRYVPPSPPPPNFIFMRDLFLMTPQGAVLARMGAAARAGEERFAAHALATLGVPILHTIHGDATFEGADALWLNAHTLLLGVGRRTSRSTASQLQAVLEGIDVIAVDMPGGVQHLLGVVNFVRDDLAVAMRDKVTVALRSTLEAAGVRLLELEPTREVVVGRAMNFVTVSPGHVVMPAGCPTTKQIFEAQDIRCDEVEITQYLRAAGGLGCITGILRREF